MKMKYFDEVYESIVDPGVRHRYKYGDIGSHEHVDFICSEHGEYRSELKTRVASVESGFQCCPTCSRHQSYTKKSVNNEEFLSIIYRDDVRERARVEGLNSAEKIEFICPEHGVYTRMVGYMYRKRDDSLIHGCPECGMVSAVKGRNKKFRERGWRGESEIEFENYLNENGYKTEHIRGLGRTRLKEIDIYLPEYHKGIEFDGTAYHTESYVWRIGDRYGKPVGYHNQKDLDAENLGIQLYHVCTEDYDENPEEYKNNILNWINNRDSVTIPSKFDLVRR